MQQKQQSQSEPSRHSQQRDQKQGQRDTREYDPSRRDWDQDDQGPVGLERQERAGNDDARQQDRARRGGTTGTGLQDRDDEDLSEDERVPQDVYGQGIDR